MFSTTTHFLKIVNRQVCIAVCLLTAFLPQAQAQQTATFTFSDGLSDTVLKPKMEAEIGRLLTEINAAAAANRPLQLQDISITVEARQALERRWEHSSHFTCWDEDNVQPCLTDLTGYEVRDIPVTMLNPNIKGDRLRQLVICFSRQGIITDVHPQLPELTYNNIVAGSRDVKDLERRMEIMKWVEQFRSYYDEKDLSSIEKVFSEKALIITGRVINTRQIAGDKVMLRPEVVYNRQTKKQYLSRLAQTFRKNSYIKLTFSDIHIGQHGGTGKENIYWVGLNQKWESEHYSDDGYLFLVWEFPDGGGDPLIHVRTWQPDQPSLPLKETDKFNIHDFFIP